MRLEHFQFRAPCAAQYHLFYIAHICLLMPPSKCPGCQQEFDDRRGFANHKWQCIHVRLTTVRRFKQLQARNQASQAGDGSAHIEHGQSRPDSIVVEGDGDTSAPLVYLYLLLIFVRSHVNASRMKSPTPQLLSYVPLASRIERFDFQSVIKMTFHHTHLLWLIKLNMIIQPYPATRRTSSLDTPKAYFHL